MLKAVSSSGNSGGGGGGVTSVNGETGAITFTSSGATVTITTPTGNTINLEASGGSAVSFTSITSGANTAAAMTVGTGASIATSGSGTIAATSAPAAGITGTTLASNVVISSLTQVGTITTGTWNGSIIDVPHGGTGLGTLTAHAVVLGEGTSAVGFATIGTAGRILVDQGAGADPAFEVVNGDATLSSTATVTLATVNSNTGSFGSSTSIPNFTVNGKGLITAAGGNVVIAPAGTLSGNTLASGVVNSSLTQVGTIQTGTWQGSVVQVPFGGTGTSSMTAHAVLLGEGTFTVGYATIGTSGRLLIDQGSGADPSFNAMSGDATITNAGAITIANNAITTVKIAANAVTNAKMATSTVNSLAGYDGSGNFSDVTVSTGLSLSGGVLTATGGGGGVSSITGDGTIINNSGSTGAVTLTLANTPTGSGSVVLATAPTMTNPVVGTQTASDNSTKAASTAYVTSAISTAVSGVNPAIAVQAATTQASDTSGLTYNNGVSGVGATLTGVANTALTVDGFTFTAINQRILVKNDTQSPSGAFNGVYFVSQIQTAIVPIILTRALDYDQPSDINNTGAIPVVNGTANASTTWVLTSAVATVGTDPLTYTQFSLNPTTIQTTTLTNGDVWIGNGSNIATAHAFSGDFTITNTGSATIANNAVTTAKINNSAVTYAKIQNEAASTLLGNPTGSPAAPSEITLDSTLAFSSTTLKATTATSSQLGVVKPDNSTITISGGIISATTGGGGSVTSVATGTGLTGGPITTTGTVSMATNTANTLAGFDNSGIFSDVTIGSNLTLSGGVLNATGGGGGTNLGLMYAIASANLIM